MTFVSSLGAQAAEQTPGAAEGVFSATWLLIALPLLGAAVLVLGGRRLRGVAPVLGCIGPAAAFVLGLVLFTAMLGRGEDERAFSVPLWDWFSVGAFAV